MHKIAAIQMCSSQHVNENLANAAKLVEDAASQGAKLVVLPEMFPIFGTQASDKVMLKELAGVGPIQDFLSSLARRCDIWIVGGTIPLQCAHPNKIRAACIVFDNQGRQIARYDKIHLFDVTLSKQEVYKESDTTEPGEEIIVIDTPVGKLGLCVCFDMRFPEILAKISAQGAEIIAIPAAFTVPTGKAHWELLARCRAIDTFCYIIGACQGGVHSNGRKTYGHSLVVDPWGEIMDEVANDGPGIAYGVVDLDKIYEIRNKIPVINAPNSDDLGSSFRR